MGLIENVFTRSLWVFHIAASPCNNCDIEVLDLITPRFDVERFGIQLIGSIRHADVLLVSGVVNNKSAKRIKKLYQQAPKPCLVVAIGSCACTQHMFKPTYSIGEPLDKILPVDLYISGCPPKPEAMIAGIAKLIAKATK